MLRGAGQEGPGHDLQERAVHEVLLPRQAGDARGPALGRSRFLKQAESWAEGSAYRLRVKGRQAGTAPAGNPRHPPGRRGRRRRRYDFFDLVESSDQDPEELFQTIHACIDKCIDDPRSSSSSRRSSPTTPTSSRRCRRRRTSTTLHRRAARARLEHDADRRRSWPTITPSITTSSTRP